MSYNIITERVVIMTTFTTKSGQVFEQWESRAEAIHDVLNIIHDMKLAIQLCGHTNNDSLWVQYKDKSHYSLGYDEENNTFKKTNISSIIYTNENTTCIFGNTVLYNMDDIDEIYSEAVDKSYKFWNVDPL